jgi:carboxyl-terminal processing protease
MPTGDAPALTCGAARVIIAQVRKSLAYAPEPVDKKQFASATADWLDPYGLWSVAPDAPIAAVLEKRAGDLLADLEGRTPACRSARDVGRQLAGWVEDLRSEYDRARVTLDAGEGADAPALAVGEAVFEGSTITRPARELASLLGQRVGTVERGLGETAAPFTKTARARYFPTIDDEAWGRIILAAAVRAYVPLVDPHGAWAPLDEESSVYEIDLEAHPPSRLWERASRTPLGVRVDTAPLSPLRVGDVVLSIAGVSTAGLPLEQIEQLGYAAGESKGTPEMVVLREGESVPRKLLLEPQKVEAPSTEPVENAGGDDLPLERVAYGDGDVLVVPIHDVRDDLGDMLTRAILRERQREEAPLTGVVLDLRGNGGGSTDGAIEALGIFIPGAPLFPMRRRDGSLETDRAPEPPTVDRWTGPVATLVDSETASAAEMIAGALGAYHRGPTIGSNTFGKGCAQEYLDDDAHLGVLRLTTLLYALPDGSPVQRIGLTPTIPFAFALPEVAVRDREANLPHAPPSWRGPDVRERDVLAHAKDGTWTVTWPTHAGRVGPCQDAEVCRALRALAPSSTVGKRVAKGR